MNARVAAVSILLAGLLSPGWSLAAEAPIETRHLRVSDATGRLSSQQLKTLADEAQATMGKVLAFWSADAGLDRFGKIRVVFDAPRRDIYGSVFYWSEGPAGRVRTLRVLKGEGPPQMLAHKLPCHLRVTGTLGELAHEGFLWLVSGDNEVLLYSR